MKYWFTCMVHGGLMVHRVTIGQHDFPSWKLMRKFRLQTSFILFKPFIELEGKFCVLSHCGPVTAYGHINQHWPGNGVVHDCTKPLHESVLTSRWWCSGAFTWKQFHSEWSCYYFCMMCLKIILFESLPYFIMTLSNENMSALLSLCAGNHQAPTAFPHKGTVKRPFDASFC